jgi:FkbM family methyltransferase
MSVDDERRIGVMTKTIAAGLRSLPHFRGLGRIASTVVPKTRFTHRDCESLVLEGSRIRVWPRSHIGWHLYCHGTYEPTLRAVMRERIPQGGIVVEAGANIGWHTLLLSRLVGRDGRVHAFEPNPKTNAELERNLALNSASNVRVYSLGLSNRTAESAFVAPEISDASAGDGHLALPLEKRGATCPVMTVNVVPLSEVAADFDRLDFLKIDVEGHEPEVLEGAMDVIARFRPVVAFEVIPEFGDRGAGQIAESMNRLAQLGYDLTPLDDAPKGRAFSIAASYSGNVLAVHRGVNR